jgi:hypothetical protein
VPPPRAQGCGAGAAAVRRFQQQQQAAFVDLVAQGDLEFLDHAGVAGRDLHRGLVGFDGDQALLDLDRVADLDQQLDHGDVLEIADVGDLDFHQCHVLVSGASGVQRVDLVGVDAVLGDGLGHLGGGHAAFVGQRLERGHHDVVAVDLEVLRSLLRKSLRPKPSVPSTL